MSARERDPYRVLGLEPGASQQAIRTRYRELVARYHPDRHPNNPLSDLAQDKLSEINWAYQELTGQRERQRSSRKPSTAEEQGRAGPFRLNFRNFTLWLLLPLVGWLILRLGARAPVAAAALLLVAALLMIGAKKQRKR